MAEYRELKCPYGDDFEGGDECDSCVQYELCMETYPPVNLIEIPKGATIGDMIKMLFPSVEVDEKSEDTVHLKDKWHNPLVFIQIPKDIWDLPYKKEVEE
jgi:hypothetical protein